MSEHGHNHDAPPNPYLEKRRNGVETAELEARVKKIEDMLVGKGIVTTEALDRFIEIYEHDLGPMNGAKVVARAWTEVERTDENVAAVEDHRLGVQADEVRLDGWRIQFPLHAALVFHLVDNHAGAQHWQARA